MTPELSRVLDRTGRSFALSLKVLPRETRAAVAVAYLLARAADTVADTRLIARDERLALLRRLAAVIRETSDPVAQRAASESILARISGASPVAEERELIELLPEVFEAFNAQPWLERRLIEKLLATITAGMTWDLERFPGEDAAGLEAFDELEELDRYCWHVAGCVGEFWTELHAARLASFAKLDVAPLRARAVRFGRALQMTNILRDVPRDLSHGRCYLPRKLLARAGLAPRDLLDPRAFDRLAPVWRELLARTDDDCREAFAYTLALPRSERGLRLATALPLLLAHPTLALLARGNPLDPRARRKVPRREVWVALGTASAAVALDWVARDDGALAWTLRRARRFARIRSRADGATLAAS